MDATNTATVTRRGRRYFVEFFRNGEHIGSVTYRRRADMDRNLRAHGVVVS